MSKLALIKEWLNLTQAAYFLSSELGEEITTGDILELALEGKCTISVSFRENVVGRRGAKTDFDNIEVFLSYPSIESDCFVSDEILDLILNGSDKQNLLNYMTRSERLDFVKVRESIKGLLLESDKYYCQLLEPFEENSDFTGSDAYYSKLSEIDEYIPPRSEEEYEYEKRDRNNFIQARFNIIIDGILYVPRLNLPSYTEYGVRTEELRKVLSMVDSKKFKGSVNPFQSRERNTLLVLFAAMCNQANFDYTERGISKAIEAATESIGARVSDDTIRKVLAQIPDALESKK